MKKIWKIFVGVIFLAVCSGCGIKKEQKKTIEDTKEKIYRECEMLAEGYRNIYENAVKENAVYELSTIQKSMDYFGKYGYAVIDSYNQLDMVQSIKVDDFLKKAEKEKNGKTTIFQVIAVCDSMKKIFSHQYIIERNIIFLKKIKQYIPLNILI